MKSTSLSKEHPEDKNNTKYNSRRGSSRQRSKDANPHFLKNVCTNVTRKTRGPKDKEMNSMSKKYPKRLQSRQENK